VSRSALQVAYRTTIERREALERQLGDVRSRAADTEAATSVSHDAAVDLHRAYGVELEKVADGGDGARVAELKAAALAAWADHDGRNDAVKAAHKLIERLEVALAEAKRAEARAAEALAVAIAVARRQRFRAAVTVMAEEARAFHSACFAADRARYAATGQVGGEPVAHTGSAHARLVGGSDEGIDGILRANGIGIDWMPLRTRIEPMSEAELLAADEDSQHEGAALTTGANQ
jgi:hypothetical protein